MAKQAITFPKVKGTNVWRNARTGTLIQRSEPGNGDGTYYSVLAPSIEPGGRHVIATPTLAEAREIAAGVVTATLERRDADHAEAVEIDQIKGWLARHGVERITGAEVILAAREADHAEALRYGRDHAPVAEHVGQLVRFRDDFSDALIGVEFVIDELSRASAYDGRRIASIKHYRKGRGWTYRLACLNDLRTVADGRPLAPHAGHDGTDAMAMLNLPITAADVA